MTGLRMHGLVGDERGRMRVEMVRIGRGSCEGLSSGMTELSSRSSPVPSSIVVLDLLVVVP